jgi:hypothetical protein
LLFREKILESLKEGVPLNIKGRWRDILKD